MKNVILFLVMIVMCENVFAVLQFDRTPKIPFQIAATNGILPNIKLKPMFFKASGVSDTPQTLWPVNSMYVFPPAAAIMTVSSSDVDDSSAGTGLRSVLIECLDVDYIEFSEVVTLNGQTGVPMAKACFRVQGYGMTGVSAGASGVNEGKIYIGTGTITTGVPANIYNLIDTGDNLSKGGFVTIPAKKVGIFVSFALFNGSTNRVAKVIPAVQAPGTLRYETSEILVGQTPYQVEFTWPARFGEKTDFTLTGFNAENSNLFDMSGNAALMIGDLF